MRKNDIVTVMVEDMSVNGEGIGKVDGYTLFIKDTIIGDEAEVKVTKVKSSYGYARLMKILTPSPDRVPPRCPAARSCGGCQIQEMRYDRQLQFKEDQVRDALQRIGEVPDDLLKKAMMPIIGMEDPFRYRNKAQFPVGKDKEGNPVIGLYAGRTHQIIPVTDCQIEPEKIQEILEILRFFLSDYGIEPYDETDHTGLVRHVLIRVGFATGQIMVCLVLNGEELPHQEELIQRLKTIPGMTSITLNFNTAVSNVILGEKGRTIWGQGYITDRIGEVSYHISPKSFYQVNPVQCEKLYDQVLDFAQFTGDETVWDLYSGIGTISLYVAPYVKQVYGVEVVPEAVEDAKENAVLNGIQNVSFYQGKAEDILPKADSADVIIVDPPRKGCQESLLMTMVNMSPEKIVYVSCDPATLARDVKILRENGYEVAKIRPIDNFCQTIHTESVLLLTK